MTAPAAAAETTAAAAAGVSIVIATACESVRATAIERAIASVSGQGYPDLDLIVVANGDRIDAEVLDRLAHDSRLRLFTLEEGNVSAARQFGLAQAQGGYFGFLDDDDELLPGAVAQRVELMRHHPEADFVVTNGFVQNGSDVPLVDAALAARINDDPAGSALATNYFASAAALFRSARIEPDIFGFRYMYFEWTYLLFSLLARGKRLRYADCVTYRMFANSARSASASEAYVLAYPDFLVELRALPLDKHIDAALVRKHQAALHAASNMHLARDRLGAAWGRHAQSLAGGGWRYLAHTRHLVRASLGRLARVVGGRPP
ncbi:MAG TPA: glycosyltransferase family A protein [Casimicrobiaceae bacterium]|nr:glycosyltransferase family A protein [Casimicrobiaceae bacterium]